MASRPTIKTLQSFRFFFALMVFGSHLGAYTEPGTLSHQLYESWWKEGYIGVSFFFVLSGFVISYQYLSPVKEGRLSITGFWKQRWARIYPLHVICLLISIPVVAGSGEFHQHLPTFFKNLALIQSYFPEREVYFSFNGPSWSLSNEFLFYLLFPILVPVLSQRRKVFITMAVLFIALLAIMHLVPGEDHHYLFYVHPVMRLPDFLLGVALFHVFHSMRGHSFQKPDIMEPMALALFLLAFSLHDLVPQVFRYSLYYWIPISLMILVFSREEGVLSRILSARPLVLLGEISFGFYLLHQLVLRYIDGLWNRFLPDMGFWTKSSIAFACILVLSLLSYRYIETPVKKYILRKNNN